jgi:hypothetical protein
MRKSTLTMERISDEDRIFNIGDRVWVFDSLLFKNDKSTPLSYTVRKATVIEWIGYITEYYSPDLSLGPYDSCVTVLFDHRPERASPGHFTYAVEFVEGE